MFLLNLVKILGGDERIQHIHTLPEFSPWDGLHRHYLKYFAETQPPEGIPQDKFAAFAKLTSIASVRQGWQRDLRNSRVGPIFVQTHWVLGSAFGYELFDYSSSLGGIYCIRNPLDVALSLAAFLHKPTPSIVQLMAQEEAFLAAENATDYLGSWTENVVSWTRQRKLDVCVVRYEDLLDNPQVWFEAIARHVFKPSPTADQVRRAFQRSAFGVLKTQEQLEGFPDMPGGKFFRSGRKGEWKAAMASRDVHQIFKDHGEQMARFGYGQALGSDKSVSLAG